MSTRVFDIHVKAASDELLRPDFDDVAITTDRSVMRLRVVACDPAALHGVLVRVAALGLELLDVHVVDDHDELTGSDDGPAKGVRPRSRPSMEQTWRR